VTDEVLMRLVRDGDLAKLGLLFERHHTSLYDFFYRTTGDRGAAEDMVQDVFVRILKYRRTFRNQGRFVGWLFHIARNTRADHFRSRQREERLSGEEAETPSTAPAVHEVMEADEQRSILHKALMQLPDEKREVIVLARYQGMKHDQIAEVLDVDVGTARVRLHRAINELRSLVSILSKKEPPCAVEKPEANLRIV
jgi:RNA polymerase sigma-70 factor (ECF subfamily)